MLNRIYRYFIFLCVSVCLVFTSCKTKEKTVVVDQNVESFDVSYQTLSLKTALSFSMRGRSLFTTNAQVRIKKDSIIQISVQPLAGVEVMRAFFSTEGMMVVDRINKRYATMSYKELQDKYSVNLNYHSLQSVFFDVPFAYESDKVAKKFDFSISQLEGGRNFMQRAYKEISQEFVTDSIYLVQSGTILSGSSSVRWSCMDFSGSVGDRRYPVKMQFTLQTGGNATVPSCVLEFAHKKIDAGIQMNFSYTVPENYVKLSLEEMIKMYL